MPSDAYSFRFTDNAYAELDEILNYISSALTNKEAAAAFLDELKSKIDEICQFPQSGQIVENEYLLRSEVRKVFVKNYIVYYLADDFNKDIIILCLTYGRRNQEQILKKF